MDRYAIIGDWAHLCALRAQWDALWERVPSNYVLEDFAWAKLCWEMPRDPGAALYSLTGWRGETLALVWPFTVRSRRGLRIARPLAVEWGDYSTVLADADQRELADAWQKVRTTCPCDLFDFPFVRAGSALHGLISEGGTRSVPLYTLPAPWVRRPESWEQYWRSLSRQRRMKLERLERRLAEQGSLVFETITDPERADPIIDWIVEHKRDWIDRSGVTDAAHTESAQYRRFLHAAIRELGPSQKWVVFALSLNGKVIAADLSSIERHRAGWYTGSYDADYHKYSVGMLLRKRSIQWAFARGLDVDMRLGDNLYKQLWQNRVELTITYRCANSPKGMAYVYGRRGLNTLRQLRERARQRRQALVDGPAPVSVGDPPH